MNTPQDGTPQDSTPQDGTRTLVERAKGILLSPREEWPRIASEEMTVAGIFRHWVLILAAIGPVAGFLGGQIFGHGLLGIRFRPGLVEGLGTAIASYVLAIFGTYLVALIFRMLATRFDGRGDFLPALKLAAFSFTAAWVAGIFALLPSISWLGILGLYSFYLLYLGAPVLLGIPEAKAVSFTVVAALLSFVMFLAIGALATSISGLFSPRTASVSTGKISGKVSIPGVGQLDLSELEAAADRMGSITGADTAGGPAQAIPIDQLQGLLPEKLGKFSRFEISSSSAGAAGLGGAQAEGRYRHGDDSFDLQIMDIAVLGGFAAFADAIDMQSSRQTETGYAKTGKVKGRITTEEWDNSSRRGKYSVLVANRFLIEASGSAPDIAVLKEAVQSVGFKRLEKLAA